MGYQTSGTRKKLVRGALFFLAILLVFQFSACSLTSEAEVPLLVTACDELAMSDGSHFEVEIWEGAIFSDMRVHITPELMQGISRILRDGESVDANDIYPIRAATSQIVIWGTNSRPLSIYIFILEAGYSTPSVDKTLVSIRSGEEEANYYFETEVGNALYSLIKTNYVPNTVEIESGHVTLDPPDTFPEHVHPTSFLELGDELIALYSWTEDYSTDGNFNSRHVMTAWNTASGEVRYSAEIGVNLGSIELYQYRDFELRLHWMDGTITYMDREFSHRETDTLPEPLMEQYKAKPYDPNDIYQSAFDIYAGGSVAAVTDSSGITLWVSGEITHIGIEEIPLDIFDSLPSSTDEVYGHLPPFFSRPRLMNGGNTLVCVLNVPSSTNDQNGLFFYDIPSGEMYWHSDLLDDWWTLRYMDESTVLVASLEEIITFDLNTYKTTQRQNPLFGQPNLYSIYDMRTVDFEAFVLTERIQLEDGSERTEFSLLGQPGIIFSGVSGPYCLNAIDITQHYLIIEGTGSEEPSHIAVRYR